MSAENSIAAMNNTLIESKHFSVEAFQQTSESSPRMLLESCATEDADRDTDITLYSNMGSRSEARVISEHMVDDEYMQLPAHLENFEESAQDIWEDMRSMLRKLLRHASDTLRDSKENPRQHSPLHHYDPTPGQGAPILSLNMSSAERKELNALRLERVKFNKQRENEKVPAKTKRELEEERAMREILVLEAARIKKERGEIEAKEAKKRAKERAYRESEERRLKSLGAFTYKPEQWR
jgi:hypothetical protein